MKSTVERLTPTRVKLVITADEQSLRPRINSAYKQLAKQISVPGFRKGKAPTRIIDQRVGRPGVLNQAVGDSIDDLYRQAVIEQKLSPVGAPRAEVIEWPNLETFAGDLVLSVEVEVVPEIILPDISSLRIEVEDLGVSDQRVDQELDSLRTRFGSLATVDRPAKKGDFVKLDVRASIDAKPIDSASGLSYEIGSGQMLPGLDEALLSLTAGEETVFVDRLLGGEHKGEEADITVRVLEVKERRLPEADDAFAQTASEFDTLEELKVSLREHLEHVQVFERSVEAREKLVGKLLELTDFPLPDSLKSGLEQTEDKSLQARNEQGLRRQLVLDRLVLQEEVNLSSEELEKYIAHAAAEQGQSREQFVSIIQQSGQVDRLIADITRNKALAIVLNRVQVFTSSGRALDISEFTLKGNTDPKVRGGSASD